MRLLVLCFFLFIFVDANVFAEPAPVPYWQDSIRPIKGANNVIYLKPEHMAPKGASTSNVKELLTRTLGKAISNQFSGLIGMAYSLYSLEEGRAKVAYAMEQLEQNGQPITPETIQEWIAQDHGIDTSISPDDLDYSDKIVTFEGNTLVLKSSTPYVSTSSRVDYGVSHVCGSGPSATYVPGYPGWQLSVKLNGSCYSGMQHYGRFDVDSAVPSVFNPADHPELFGSGYYPPNAIESLVNRGLDNFDIKMHLADGYLEDHVYVDMEAVNKSLVDPTSQLVPIMDPSGYTYYVPVGAIGEEFLPEFEGDTSGVSVETQQGQTSLPSSQSNALKNAGIPERAVITRVNPNTGLVTYTDPVTGISQSTQIDPEIAKNLATQTSVATSASPVTPSVPFEFPEVSVSGTIAVPNPAMLEPVTSDRIEASKNKFLQRWNDLKLTFSGIFDVNLSGTGHLPIWHWVILGKSITLDFNDYATELNWIGLAVVLLASISAVFIVIDK